MAPNFGLDDGSNSDFNATLVLATMLVSQLHEGNPLEHPPAAPSTERGHDDQGEGSQQQERSTRAAVSEHASDHTRIWSELSGSAAKSTGGADERQGQAQGSANASGQSGMQRINPMGISNTASARGNVPNVPNPIRRPMDIDHVEGPQPQDRPEMNDQGWSQHHPSNWVGADEDDDMDESELCVQSTPPY